MIMLIEEFLTGNKDIDEEDLPPSWHNDLGRFWREEQYMDRAYPLHDASVVHKELETLRILGIRGYVVVADDIEHEVVKIRLTDKKLVRDEIPLDESN